MNRNDVGEVVMEMHAGKGWQRIGSQSIAEPPGSLSSYEPQGRQVYVFGWLVAGEGPGVWRSASGADVEVSTFRQVVTTGLVHVADLTTGPHQMTLRRAEGGTRVVRLRWLT